MSESIVDKVQKGLDFFFNLGPKIWEFAKWSKGFLLGLVPLATTAFTWFMVRTEMFIQLVDRLINGGFDQLSLPQTLEAPLLNGLSFLNACVPLDVIAGILVTASALWVTVLVIRSALSILKG